MHVICAFYRSINDGKNILADAFSALIKRKSNFLIYKEIQSRAVAKSFMRKGFLIYEAK
jgi:hypothetical protein